MNEFEENYYQFLPLVVKQGKVPQYLCKYLTIDKLKYYLEDNTIYFSNFEEMNDKYEAYARYDVVNSDEEWKNLLQKMSLPYMHQRIILDVIKNNPQKVGEIILDNIKQIASSLGILCLTPDNDNITMWAHYADNNKGACVEFDILEDCKLFLLPKKVEYSDDIVCLNYIAEQDRAMEPLYHKSTKWSYENEYRVIKTGFRGPRKFNKKALRSIVFGVDTCLEDIQRVKEMAARNGFDHVAFKQARQSQNSITKFDIVES